MRVSSVLGLNCRGRYSGKFFAAYFFYYAGYCVFSSYIVSYLTELGYSASLCGSIASLALVANLLMEPIGGYITDTFLSVRRYLILCIVVITGLCLVCTFVSDIPWLCMTLLMLTAGVAYPFSQLMDAWVNCSMSVDSTLVYSRIRAGGSIGFAVSSILAGYYFDAFGWGSYFIVQAVMFLCMIPFLIRLPLVELGNRHTKEEPEHSLTLGEAFGVLLRSHRYLFSLLICTVYWFSHRPVGSYLALIINDRGGDAGTFGSVCGIGAAVEFFGLMLLAAFQKRKGLFLRAGMTAALLTNLLRPACILLLPGLWPLYVGQILQSISFAFFLSVSVDCFAQTADSRIRSFCISVGLTASSVGGTILANMLGGWLCDLQGTTSLVVLSLGVSLFNCALLVLMFRHVFQRAEQGSELS